VGVVGVEYLVKMAEISSGRSLKPNIPREPKLGYVLRLQRLIKNLEMLWVIFSAPNQMEILYNF